MTGKGFNSKTLYLDWDELVPLSSFPVKSVCLCEDEMVFPFGIAASLSVDFSDNSLNCSP